MIGYAVYLSVAFFTGELYDNTIDLVIMYLPFTERYFHDRLSMRRERINSKHSRHQSKDVLSSSLLDHTQSMYPDGGSFGGGDGALYDDASTTGQHINYADMSMGTNDVVAHQNQESSEDVRPSQLYPDFGTDFTRSNLKATPVPRGNGGATLRAIPEEGKDSMSSFNSFGRGSQVTGGQRSTVGGPGSVSASGSFGQRNSAGHGV